MTSAQLLPELLDCAKLAREMGVTSRRPYPKNRKSPRGKWRDMLGEFWARVEVNRRRAAA